MSDNDEPDPSYAEDHVSFAGERCKCDHEPEDHGWMACDIEGCECEAGWEE